MQMQSGEQWIRDAAGLSADLEGKSFGAIEVRKYKRTLEDHLCVSLGAPVTLRKTYQECHTMSRGGACDITICSISFHYC